MQQLNQQDAMFVHSETARAPMHLSSLHLYDPATSPAGEVTFPQFRRARALPPPAGQGAAPQAGAGAVRPRPPVLGRGQGVRPRVPRAPRRAAVARRLAGAVGPGRPAPCAAARPRPAAVGALLHRGRRRRGGLRAGQLRHADQDPPQRDRRDLGHRADERPARPRPGRPGAGRRSVAGGGRPERGRAAHPLGTQRGVDTAAGHAPDGPVPPAVASGPAPVAPPAPGSLPRWPDRRRRC